MKDHEADRRIELVARRQEGVFSRTQAYRVGFSSQMIDDRLQWRAWLRLAPAVYALASHPGSFERQCWAAVLAEADAAVGGMSAAWLHRFADVRPGRVEVVVGPACNARNPLAIVHRYDGALITSLKGLPITTVAQTVFDIANRTSYPRMERILDALLLDRRVSVEVLDERLAAYEGTRRPGLPLMRAMLEDRRQEGWAPSESELEDRLDRILRNLPGDGRVERQRPFPWRKAPKGRVDRWLPGYGLIVEADGRRWHARLHDFDADRWRDNRAAANGVTVLRFTWVHLTRRAREARQLVIDAGRSSLSRSSA